MSGFYSVPTPVCMLQIIVWLMIEDARPHYIRASLQNLAWNCVTLCIGPLLLQLCMSRGSGGCSWYSRPPLHCWSDRYLSSQHFPGSSVMLPAWSLFLNSFISCFILTPRPRVLLCCFISCPVLFPRCLLPARLSCASPVFNSVHLSLSALSTSCSHSAPFLPVSMICLYWSFVYIWRTSGHQLGVHLSPLTATDRECVIKWCNRTCCVIKVYNVLQ